MSDRTTSHNPIFSHLSLSSSTHEPIATATTEAVYSLGRRFTILQEEPNRTSTKSSTWSAGLNNDLTKLIAGDLLVGTSVTFCVAPFVAVVDQAIVQRSAGTHTIMASVQSTMAQMFRHPTAYFRSTPFLWMWALYAATYSTANTLKTLQEYSLEHKQTATTKLELSSPVLCTSPFCPKVATVDEHREIIASSNIVSYHSRTSISGSWSMSGISGAASTLLASSLGVLVGTSAVNMTMSLLKDRAYAQMFGGKTPSACGTKPLTVPKLSYALWMTRDFMVVGSSFILPDMLVRNLLTHGHIDPTQTSTTLKGAQFMIPVLSQIVAGPIHLLGLNVYQQPSLAPLDRLQSLQRGAVSSVICARMARILPGYSIGGVGNSYLRDQWRNHFKTYST